MSKKKEKQAENEPVENIPIEDVVSEENAANYIEQAISEFKTLAFTDEGEIDDVKGKAGVVTLKVPTKFLIEVMEAKKDWRDVTISISANQSTMVLDDIENDDQGDLFEDATNSEEIGEEK